MFKTAINSTNYSRRLMSWWWTNRQWRKFPPLLVAINSQVYRFVVVASRQPTHKSLSPWHSLFHKYGVYMSQTTGEKKSTIRSDLELTNNTTCLSFHAVSFHAYAVCVYIVWPSSFRFPNKKLPESRKGVGWCSLLTFQLHTSSKDNPKLVVDGGTNHSTFCNTNTLFLSIFFFFRFFSQLKF